MNSISDYETFIILYRKYLVEDEKLNQITIIFNQWFLEISDAEVVLLLPIFADERVYYLKARKQLNVILFSCTKLLDDIKLTYLQS